MTEWLLGTALVAGPFVVLIAAAAWWNLRQSEKTYREAMDHIDRVTADEIARTNAQLAALRGRPRFTVTDGLTTLTLEPSDQGGYVVTSPSHPAFEAKVNTIEEAFAKFEEADAEPATAQ